MLFEPSRRSTHNIVGAALMALPAIAMIFSSALKFVGVPGVREQMAALGFEGGKLLFIAVLEIVSVGLFLWPRTRSLGLLLVAAYLGGAICTHVQAGEYAKGISPAMLLVLAWTGTGLRYPQMLWSFRAETSGTSTELRESHGMAKQSYTAATYQTASRFRKLLPWFSRLVMLPPTIIFTVLSLRYFTNPGEATSGTTLNTPEAFTDTRVLGAWILTLLIMLLMFLFANKRLWLGHLQIAVFMAATLVVRIFGFLHDGTTLAMGNQRVITIVEIVFLTLNAAGLFWQSDLTSKRLE